MGKCNGNFILADDRVNGKKYYKGTTNALGTKDNSKCCIWWHSFDHWWIGNCDPQTLGTNNGDAWLRPQNIPCPTDGLPWKTFARPVIAGARVVSLGPQKGNL